MGAQLNRKQSYGQVWGIASHCYEQDGKLFDQEGEEVVADKRAVVATADVGNDKDLPPVVNAIQVDGERVVLDGLDAPALHVIAAKLGVAVHPKTGAVKLMAALLASQPLDQLDAQLQG